ncbi:hypothetical protein EV421DRAFT_1742175 [Armillaria borealis]|uniref:Uncharacterized protein n=1 Tax=Armillaria borealis TaxID=47425 RepID=A0AA39IYA3_9AGAR|nr:hypothetical protein EV421DRAFT_1742175 [Armillaria borealis]
MVRTILVQEVAKYMTWSLISWDYLITLDDEVRPYTSSRVGLPTDQLKDHFVLVLKEIMDQILVLCVLESLYGTHSADVGYRLCALLGEHLEDADHPFSYFLCRCGKGRMLPSFTLISSEDAIEACLVATESGSVLYVTMQLFVIESILVLRVWAIMGRRRWILWTFFGLLVCSTATSIVLNGPSNTRIRRFEITLVAKCFSVLFSVPFMAFLDPRLGLTIMSVTISHMLLRLRKQVLSDTVGPPSQKVELTTFRATTNGAMSLEVGRDVIDIGPYPEGS